MKLENQVCTLEQAKRLKELGVISESYAMWLYHFPTGWVAISFVSGLSREQYPAYTVAELGVMLPDYITGDELYTPTFSKGVRNEWSANYYGISKYLFDKERRTRHRIEAQSRANLLIHLLESGKITAEEVNNRLSLP